MATLPYARVFLRLQLYSWFVIMFRPVLSSIDPVYCDLLVYFCQLHYSWDLIKSSQSFLLSVSGNKRRAIGRDGRCIRRRCENTALIPVPSSITNSKPQRNTVVHSSMTIQNKWHLSVTMRPRTMTSIFPTRCRETAIRIHGRNGQADQVQDIDILLMNLSVRWTIRLGRALIALFPGN